MVPWGVCGWCSGGHGSRQRGAQNYRYEVVYRRDDSLYSGPDYLESLPGGRTRPPLIHPGYSGHPNPFHPPPHPLHHGPPLHHPPPHHLHHHQRLPSPQHPHSLNYRYPSPLQLGIPVGPRLPPPAFHSPAVVDSLTRQNRHNQQLLRLHSPAGRQGHHQYPSYNRQQAWLSAGNLGADTTSRPPPALPGWRSAPILPPHYRDSSISSRDASRSDSRDISQASSAHSTRPLLGGGGGGRPLRPRPPPLITKGLPSPPDKRVGPPYSPRTPLSPGPPGYAEAFSF
ncbi:unnamed protein product, partial [Meganyctiphanes norvegica]